MQPTDKPAVQMTDAFTDDDAPHVVEPSATTPSTATDQTETVFEDSFKNQPSALDDDLSSMYNVDNERDPVDMTTMERKRKYPWKWIVVAIVLLGLVGGIGYAGFQLFHTVADSGQDSGTVDVTMTTDSSVSSGDQITLDIAYTNHRTKAITGDISMTYPDGWSYTSASIKPTDNDSRHFTIDRVEPGATGHVSIVGQLVGGTKDQKEFAALLTYQPDGLTQNFQQRVTAQTQITSALLDMTVKTEDQVESGQTFDYVVKIKNTSDNTFQHVAAKIVLPAGMTIKETTPTTDTPGTWTLDELAAGAEEKIAIKAVIDAESGESKEVKAQLGFVELDNSFTVQVEKTSTIKVNNPELDLKLNVPAAVSVGTEVPLTVTVTNTSSVDLRDVQIQLDLPDEVFTDSDHAFTIDTLTALQSEDLAYTATVKDTIDSDQTTFTMTAQVTQATVEGTTLTFDKTATADIQIAARLGVTAAAYFDKSAGSTGPATPTVGEESLYIVRWTIDTGGHTFDTARISTTLPSGVTWADIASPNVTYDPATRTVSYEADQVVGNSDQTVGFGVTITPKQNQVGDLISLTQETTVVAVDHDTASNVSSTVPVVTTLKAAVAGK